MSQFHIVSKRIDNSRLVRFAAPGSGREDAAPSGSRRPVDAGDFSLRLAALSVCIQLSYQIESLKSQQPQAAELHRQLTLESASLRSPARIDEIARQQLGLTAPAAGQLQPFEAPSEPILAEMQPADSTRDR